MGVSYLLRSDWSLVGPSEFFNDSWVASEILLAANEEDRETTAEVLYLGNPLRGS